jgi:hypothetical protein
MATKKTTATVQRELKCNMKTLFMTGTVIVTDSRVRQMMSSQAELNGELLHFDTCQKNPSPGNTDITINNGCCCCTDSLACKFLCHPKAWNYNILYITT